MKLAIQLAVFTIGAALLIPAAHAQKKSFTATLSGAVQVPAVKTMATGHATFRLSKDGQSISYTLTVKKIDHVTMAHIHLAPAGKDGPPVVWLYPTKTYTERPGKVSGLLSRGTFTAAQLVGPLKGKPLADLLKDMRDGDAYVNVHTTANPGGEIRGQIR